MRRLYLVVLQQAGVAQLVEQRIRNAKVGSSTLLAGTNKNSVLATNMAGIFAGHIFLQVPIQSIARKMAPHF